MLRSLKSPEIKNGAESRKLAETCQLFPVRGRGFEKKYQTNRKKSPHATHGGCRPASKG
jgi:hypothetical protein